MINSEFYELNRFIHWKYIRMGYSCHHIMTIQSQSWIIRHFEWTRMRRSVSIWLNIVYICTFIIKIERERERGQTKQSVCFLACVVSYVYAAAVFVIHTLLICIKTINQLRIIRLERKNGKRGREREGRKDGWMEDRAGEKE